MPSSPLRQALDLVARSLKSAKALIAYESELVANVSSLTGWFAVIDFSLATRLSCCTI
jgi:hypothetical protein